MKKIILIALVAMMSAMGSISVFAQGKYGADSAKCITYLSYYKEYFKQKNYKESLPNWRKAYSICPPTASQNMLIDGTNLLRFEIKNQAGNAAYQKALIDSLLTLQDVRAANYPKYAVTALNNKGSDMSNYFKNDPKALYEGLNGVIEANKEKTKASLFLFNMDAAIKLYQAGSIDADEVISKYQNNLALLEKAKPANDAAASMNAKVKEDIESLFIGSKVASCENLITLFTPRYEADPENLDLVTNIVKMMSSTEDCTDNELYLRAATSFDKLAPTSQSAYFLYKLHASKDNVEEAISYLDKALSYSDIDNDTKAAYNYELATFCVKNGKGAKGYEAAEIAASLNDEFAGKSYYLMGTIWGTTACGGDEIARRAPYWVACDFMQKAKAADPSLTEECNRMIGQYSAYFPQAAEAFMYDLSNGQSYTVSCGGMRATTTVRTQK